jgi:CRISPR-associated protein Cmr6
MRRAALQGMKLDPSTHAGLWLDKFYEEGQAREGAVGRHIKELAGHPIPDRYREALALRRQDFATRQDRVICAPARVQGRLVIGLGQKGPIEAGLHLEHTWGVPVLPGTALKGLASTTADRLLEDPAWRRGQGSHAALFGTNDDSGGVVFHDAWWDPEGEKALPIHLDVMTVHHQAYYGGGAAAPSDMDSPNPVAFASVTGCYLVAVEGPRPFCDAAMAILQIGLMELGLGAKTNAGYGRLKLSYESDVNRAAKAAQEAAQAQEQAMRDMDRDLSRLEKNNATDLIPQALKKYQGEAARLFAERAIAKLTRRFLMDRKDKPWVLALLQAAGGEL